MPFYKDCPMLLQASLSNTSVAYLPWLKRNDENFREGVIMRRLPTHSESSVPRYTSDSSLS